MLKREFELPIEHCPVCGARGTFRVKGRIDDIPYFGETLETLASCDNCKFKHADVTHLGEREPMRHEFLITSEDDMMVRVVRSSTGTIRVPELGVTISPGAASEGYVTNIEGVLYRIEGAIRLAIGRVDSVRRRRGESKLQKLQDIRTGKVRARLILMDPFGHSAIADERVKRRRLTKKEIAELKGRL
jgi:zinc finger protein